MIFTVVDFVGASANFSDPEWDGDPIPEDEPVTKPGDDPEPDPGQIDHVWALTPGVCENIEY